MQQYRKQFEAEGYLVSSDDIDNMNPDKPKKYVSFSGGSHDLIDSSENIEVT